MDKERLDELREETTQYRAVADDRCMSTQYEDDILALIDAEIVRQSVTDEAVKDAIEWAEREHGYCMRYMMFGDADSATLAIDALRQYRKPTDEKILDAINKLTYARDSDREFDDGTFVEALDTALACMRQMGSTEHSTRVTEPCEKCIKKAFVAYWTEDKDYLRCPYCGRPLKGEMK